MRLILFIVAIVMIVGWAIGTFVYALGGLIHILVVLGVISFVVGLFSKESSSS